MAAPFRGSASELSRQQLRAARYARMQRDVYVLTPAAITLALRVDAALTLFLSLPHLRTSNLSSSPML